jgi:hypothetical protein
MASSAFDSTNEQVPCDHRSSGEEVFNYSTTEQVDAIYELLVLPTIPKSLQYDIKFAIYLYCIKNNSVFLGLNFVNFAKKLIPYFMSTFGFPCAQACEIMIAYANKPRWLFTYDIKLSDLIVFDWYGFFSDDVRYHIRELEHNSELSLLHVKNPLFEEANALASKLQGFVKPEHTLVMLCYIYLINNHRDFVICSYSIIENEDETHDDTHLHVHPFADLCTLFSKNTKGIDLAKKLTEIIYRMDFPDELYE